MALEQLFPSFWDQTPAFLKVSLTEFLPKLAIFTERESDVVGIASTFEVNRRKLGSKYLISKFTVAERVNGEVCHFSVFGFAYWQPFFKRLGLLSSSRDVRKNLFMILCPFGSRHYLNCSSIFFTFDLYNDAPDVHYVISTKRNVHSNCRNTASLCHYSYAHNNFHYVKYEPDYPPTQHMGGLFEKRRLLGRNHWEKYVFTS